MRYNKYVMLLLMLLVSIGLRGQYNPSNPAEPGRYYALTLTASPNDAGYFNVTSGTTYLEGKVVSLRAYTNSGFKFVHWEEDGEVISTSASFSYTMPARDVTLVAHYEFAPSSPSEPSQPVLAKYSKINLSATPSDGGSFNVSSGNSYKVGTSVTLNAYNSYDFVFEKWTNAAGEVLSTSYSLSYMVTEEDADLTAHFIYAPGNPSEPSVAKLNRRLTLTASLTEAGYFNITSGNKYLEGSSVWLQAYTNDDFIFEKWMEGDSVVSTEAGFYYLMPERNVELLAVYSYDSTKLIPLAGELQLATTEYVYTGEAFCPEVTFVNEGDTALILDKDYTIVYTNNIEPGTATVSAKGLAPYFGEVSKNFTILKMEVDTALLTVLYPDSITYYDGKPHELAVRVADGMGECTVYYTDEEGRWSSNMPTELGQYTVSLVFDEGTYYKGTTIDGFYSFEIALPPALAQEEWDILVNLYAQWGGASWNNSWDLDAGIGEAASLYGVTVVEGHVTAIDLSANGLYGEFPYLLLELPYLTSLNLSSNALTGNISEGLEAYLDSTGITTVATLQNLDISKNNLQGNIGAFAATFPNLMTLSVQENSFSEVSPMLPVEMQVTLHPQHIQGEALVLRWSDITEETLLGQLPTLITYNHEGQTYELPAWWSCQDAVSASSPQWSAEFSLQGGKPSWNITSLTPYMLPNGEWMTCQDTQTGTTFKASFIYDEGDADFSGRVDVLDLQGLINYFYEPYIHFNHTMADLYQDDRVNVQDVVLMVTLLLNQEVVTAVPLSLTYINKVEAPAKATLAWADNRLMLSTEENVASFELLLEGCVAERLSWQLPEGFIVQMNEIDGFTRVVVYSLTGAELPVGETLLATVSGNVSHLVSAILSDASAREISVQLNGAVTDIEVQSMANLPCRWNDGALQLVVDAPLHQAEWSLSAMSGQIVAEGYQGRVESGNWQLPVSVRLIPGVYLFRLQAAEGVNRVEKVFVK